MTGGMRKDFLGKAAAYFAKDTTTHTK